MKFALVTQVPNPAVPVTATESDPRFTLAVMPIPNSATLRATVIFDAGTAYQFRQIIGDALIVFWQFVRKYEVASADVFTGAQIVVCLGTGAGGYLIPQAGSKHFVPDHTLPEQAERLFAVAEQMVEENDAELCDATR